MAYPMIPVQMRTPSSGNAAAVKVGLVHGPGFIAAFGSDASWYGHVAVPSGATGTANWRIHCYAAETSGNFQFGLYSIELTPGTTASNATRAQDGSDQTVTFATTANRCNEVDVPLDVSPTAGRIYELEVKGLAASTVTGAVRFEAYLVFKD